MLLTFVKIQSLSLRVAQQPSGDTVFGAWLCDANERRPVVNCYIDMSAKKRLWQRSLRVWRKRLEWTDISAMDYKTSYLNCICHKRSYLGNNMRITHLNVSEMYSSPSTLRTAMELVVTFGTSCTSITMTEVFYSFSQVSKWKLRALLLGKITASVGGWTVKHEAR